MLGVLFIAVACAPTSPAPAKRSPLAQATSSPTEEASPTPSPSPPELKITSAAFHTGELGFGYAATHATAAGGVPPYAWSVVAGAMPAGLAMDSSGIVSGTPAALGTFLFTVQVSDSGSATATIDTTINVIRRVVVTPTCPTNFPCMVEAGCLTVCGGFGNQSGGMPPYTYGVIAGAIPTGMALSGFSLTRAFPAPAGSAMDWVFTVRVTDGLGATAQTTATFHVFPHIAFTSAPAPATCAAPCRFTMSYTLGTPGLQSPPGRPTPTAVTPGAPSLATLVTVTTSQGTATVDVKAPACPQKGVVYKWNLSVVLVYGSLCGPGGAYCTTAAVTEPVTLAC